MTQTNGQSVGNQAEELVNSTMALGYAATKFAMDQMETALCAFTSPRQAMERLKRSLDNFSSAMNAPVQAGEEAVNEVKFESMGHGAFNGRKV